MNSLDPTKKSTGPGDFVDTHYQTFKEENTNLHNLFQKTLPSPLGEAGVALHPKQGKLLRSKNEQTNKPH